MVPHYRAFRSLLKGTARRSDENKNCVGRNLIEPPTRFDRARTEISRMASYSQFELNCAQSGDSSGMAEWPR